MCNASTRENMACSRVSLPGSRYCWHHQDKSAWVLGFGGLLLAILGIGLTLGFSLKSCSDTKQAKNISRTSGKLDSAFRDTDVTNILIYPGRNTNGGFVSSFPDVTHSDSGKSVFDGFRIWAEDEHVKMNAVIRDSSGNILARLAGNEWQVNLKHTFDRNYDTNGIEVLDERGDVIMQADVRGHETMNGVRHLAVSFCGIFTDSKGGRWVIGEEKWPSSKNEFLLICTMVPPNMPNYRPSIGKLFVYPSELHLGERAVLKDTITR